MKFYLHAENETSRVFAKAGCHGKMEGENVHGLRNLKEIRGNFFLIAKLCFEMKNLMDLSLYCKIIEVVNIPLQPL